MSRTPKLDRMRELREGRLAAKPAPKPSHGARPAVSRPSRPAKPAKARPVVKAVPRRSGVLLQLWVPPALLAAIDEAATLSGLSRSSWLRTVLGPSALDPSNRA